MPDGKAVKPPDSMEWLNKSQLHVMTRMSTVVIKRVLERNTDIPTKRQNAKTMLYKTQYALECIFKEKFGIITAGGDDTEGTLDEKQERAKLSREQCRNAKIKNKILLGKLIHVEDIAPHWADIVKKVRAKVLSLPNILATECVGIDDIKALEKIAKEIVYQALEELSTDMMPEIDYDTTTDDTEEDGGGDSATT